MKESTGREDITIRAKREKRQMEEEVNEPAVGKRSNPTAELIDLFFGSFPSFFLLHSLLLQTSSVSILLH